MELPETGAPPDTAADRLNMLRMRQMQHSVRGRSTRTTGTGNPRSDEEAGTGCGPRPGRRRSGVASRLRGWGLVCALQALAAIGLAAALPEASIVSLRAAIEHLQAVHGNADDSAKQCLAELRAIEDENRATHAPPAQDLPARFAALQRRALLTHPVLGGRSILFVARRQYAPDHHNTATFFPAAAREYNDGAFTPGAALKVLDLQAGGAITTLLDLPAGVLRDPEVHFDGRRVLFSMRTNAADSYHLYEMDLDGRRLRQLTFAPEADDLDPMYLPDDSIVFSSTREPKYCMCNRHIMANLHRMEADGANIHQIGKSTLYEGHPTLMPDGRVLYDRWEYVDRNFGDAQALWTVNPDGTGHAVYWGNNTASPGAVIDARILPGGEQALCIFGSCHDRPWGALAIIDRRLALDGPAAVVRTWPADATNLLRRTGWEVFDLFTQVKLKYEDPWPLDNHFFLVSRVTGQGDRMGLYLVDLFGNEILLHSETLGCFDPMPLAPRPRPPVLPSRRQYDERPGAFYVQDVYQGTHMRGIERGSVKWLRVVESPEKRFWTLGVWGGQGIEGPAMNWHDFNNKRILGVVPVHPDGSAYFEAPPNRFLYFQLLDEDRMMVQSMRSGTMVQPGEQAGCVGCHEERRGAPAGAVRAAASLAGREPDRLQGWHGPAREFSYASEVQPVFDRHCVSCHDFGAEPAKKLNLAPDRDLVFNVSYNELWRKKYIRVVGAGPSETQAPRSWGSHASRLTETLRKWRKDGKLTQEEFERVVTWMDLNAPYYPTYACAYPENLAGRSPLSNAQTERLERLTGVPLRQLAGHASNRGPQVSFDRPELSPCLQQLAPTEARRAEAIQIIQTGARALAEKPEADRPGFEPCAVDQWRNRKYRSRQEADERSRSSIGAGAKHYERP